MSTKKWLPSPVIALNLTAVAITAINVFILGASYPWWMYGFMVCAVSICFAFELVKKEKDDNG